MHRCLTLAALVVLFPAVHAAAQTHSLAIRATAEDYVLGWYDGNAERMERAIHPDLAKRQVSTMENGRSRLNHMGAMAMVQVTRNRSRSPQPADRRLLEITILDIHRSIASVKVVSWDFVDLVHMARSDRRWVIVNDLWDARQLR
jgi:hypothetical protein